MTVTKWGNEVIGEVTCVTVEINAVELDDGVLSATLDIEGQVGSDTISE